ncbi:MAG: cytochrome c biogenesis protein [Candidatus Kapaibacteriota bacterium]
MKGFIIGTGVILGLTLGFIPKLYEAKPRWWKLSAVIFLLIAILLTFVPYVASNFATFKFISQNITNFSGPLYFKIDSINIHQDSLGSNSYEIVISNPNNPSAKEILLVPSDMINNSFKLRDKMIAEVSYDTQGKKFIFSKVVASNPLLVLPYVPQLGEQIRIMNLHVPCAWVAVIAYFISMFNSIQFLRTKKFEYDEISSSSAFLGSLFAVLATVTGMIWAKINWGSFWNWDPRQTSIFVLLLIYFAYFILRQSIENYEIKARLSSVYSIIAFLTVPFLVFIMPRLLEGNHPGSANSPNIGPILSSQENTLSILQTLGFSLGFLSFTLLFFWLLNIRVRILKINKLILLRRKNGGLSS